MESLNVCRCCLSRSQQNNLDTSQVWVNMLNECFNLSICPIDNNSNGICGTCITMLNGSHKFKQQVLRSEVELLKRIKESSFSQNEEVEEKPFQVKLEPKDDDSDDSDNYFLADRVREPSVESIKKERKESPKKMILRKSKKTADKKKSENADDISWRSAKIKNLVSRLASSINSCDIPEMKSKKPIKNRKITINKNAKINLVLTRTNQDKYKHKENLMTVLKFSNATPFKNKSLLGFICGYCSAAFPDPADLRVHTDADHRKERLDFKIPPDMSDFTVKFDVMDLCCTLCDNKMENLGSLKDHLVKAHNKVFYNDIKDHLVQFKLKKGDVFDCAMCTATYETFKMLKQHMNRHYSNYRCGKCDTAFATKRSLAAHQATHQEGSFKCQHCEKIFSSRSKRNYHEKMKHMGARNISNCPYCNQAFRSYYQRNQHMVKVHNSEAQYKCNVCNKGYILKSLLMYHIKKSHLMERNCQCTECGYRFFSKKALKAHMVKHNGERVHACEVCHKAYARKYTLREHMRIHNNDRRFKCDYCGMTFVQKCSLKSHLLSNHGVSMAASDIPSM